MKNEKENNSDNITQHNITVQNMNESNKENILKIKHNKISAKIYKNCIICSSIFALIILAIIIVLIGYMAGIWIKKKEELVIQPKRQENSISRFKEIKNSSNSFFYNKGNNRNKTVQNYTIETDFIVAIYKKNIIDNHNKIDYLYESFILIINITEKNETDLVSLGGIDIYDDSKSIDDLINNNEDLFKNITLDDNNQNLVNKTQINVPICKFDFYENGTLDKVYFPPDINEFYKVAIFDLIQKVTPRISMSIYRDQTNRRRLNQNKKEGNFLNYEKIIKNGKLNKTIIYEDNFEKNIGKKENEDNYEINEINSIITRTFDFSGDLIGVEMEGEAIFRSDIKPKRNINLRLNEEKKEKISEANHSYYNLGIDEMKMNVISNMIIVGNRTINPVILNELFNLSQKVNIEGLKDLSNGIFTRKFNEFNVKIPKNFENYTGNLESQNQSKEINYLYSYKSIYNIISLNFLGLNIDFLQNLYINKNTGLRQNYATFIINKKEYNISAIDIYQYYYSGAQTTSKKLLDNSIGLFSQKLIYFGIIIKASLNINLELIQGIEIDVKNGEMYTKGFSNFDLSISGSFGPDIAIFSCGVELIGHISQGEAYIEANTLLKDNSEQTQFLYFKKFSSCSIDLEFYFSFSLILKNFKQKKSIAIYKGLSSNSTFIEKV